MTETEGVIQVLYWKQGGTWKVALELEGNRIEMDLEESMNLTSSLLDALKFINEQPE